MKKITSRAELKEKLEEIRAVEITARKGYEKDTHTFTNFALKTQIEKIKLDEDKHIEILTEIINIL